MNLEKLIPVVCASSLLAVSGCTSTLITPISVAQPVRTDITADQAMPSDVKQFTLPNDWQWGPWIVKRGGTITFRRDGTGMFSARVFAQYATGTEYLHMQAIQYGKDGNRLFAFPGADVGFPMAIRAPYTDYPYDAPFAFDPRYFDSIDSVKFYARLRLKDSHVGQYAAKRASFVADTEFDPTGRAPAHLPPVP